MFQPMHLVRPHARLHALKLAAAVLAAGLGAATPGAAQFFIGDVTIESEEQIVHPDGTTTYRTIVRNDTNKTGSVSLTAQPYTEKHDLNEDGMPDDAAILQKQVVVLAPFSRTIVEFEFDKAYKWKYGDLYTVPEGDFLGGTIGEWDSQTIEPEPGGGSSSKNVDFEYAYPYAVQWAFGSGPFPFAVDVTGVNLPSGWSIQNIDPVPGVPFQLAAGDTVMVEVEIQTSAGVLPGASGTVELELVHLPSGIRHDAVVGLSVVSNVAWTDVGHGLPGENGTPALLGVGELVPGTSCGFTLSGARPFAPAALIVGFGAGFLPFKGGTLVPVPSLLIAGIPTGPTGGLTLLSPWPAGLPSGTNLWVQMGIPDPAAVNAVALTNGLEAETP